MNSVLVICIGNICRSPMAEALLQDAVPTLSVTSAGLGALVGHPADPFSIQIMSENGIDIQQHRAQQLSRALVASAELILVMDTEQKRFIEERYPDARGKVFRLCEAQRADIPDPYRLGSDEFRNAYELIRSGVEYWAGQIAKI